MNEINAPTQREDAVFFAALNVEELGERTRFLDEACAGDDRLRAVVEDMLFAQADAELFFAKGSSAIKLPLDPPLTTGPSNNSNGGNIPCITGEEQPGSRIQRYKLLQKLGEGGCGVVYTAEQEEPVRRQVALKVIKLGMDTKSVIARFEAERQALALMDHPNIARVFDAGATDTGRPFFVMELVHGVRITEFCDHNNLDTRQRLELFIQICHAIQHAHQKGVIHRDIKPSNVLVSLNDGVPVPKVIDFGIAKATQGRLTDKTCVTPIQQFIGTPAYMSPEQAERSDLDIDTRSDIYSLGVLLYELLTGKTPFDTKKLLRSGLSEMRRALRETEPQRPSTMITTLHGEELALAALHRQVESPPKLISQLRGDLDWIVMKALEKDRGRRYETANGLAMDIQRHLNNEPVIARPPSRLYQFQKLVRRNRPAFAAAVVVIVALVLSLGAVTLAFQREAKLRRESEAREKINQAAIYVSQEKYREADDLLSEVRTPPPKPSYDGVEAFRRVGEWLALRNQWSKSADRYSTLLEIDKLDDWNVVTLDYQACGVVLAESGNTIRYERFCRAAVTNFAVPPNGDAAARILKTCLLMPGNEELIGSLRPLAAAAENYFEPMGARGFPSWAAIPMGLWEYRCGDYAWAEKWCQRGLANNDNVVVRDATIRIIMAMSEFQLGRTAEARSELAQARDPIERKFPAGLDHGTMSSGYWFDWVFARILLREADAQVK